MWLSNTKCRMAHVGYLMVANREWQHLPQSVIILCLSVIPVLEYSPGPMTLHEIVVRGGSHVVLCMLTARLLVNPRFRMKAMTVQNSTAASNLRNPWRVFEVSFGLHLQYCTIFRCVRADYLLLREKYAVPQQYGAFRLKCFTLASYMSQCG